LLDYFEAKLRSANNFGKNLIFPKLFADLASRSLDYCRLSGVVLSQNQPINVNAGLAAGTFGALARLGGG
jgi:hypothetical protein